MDTLKTALRLRLILLVIMLMGFVPVVFAGEHPSEHPANESHGSDTKTIAKEDLAVAIEAYVKKDAALKGGYFLVYDGKAKKALVLTLVKVHKDRLSKVGDDVYFACADFKTPGGKVYDLDIFMKGHDKNHLVVTEVTVHKKAGKARYSWYEEKGVWKKK